MSVLQSKRRGSPVGKWPEGAQPDAGRAESPGAPKRDTARVMLGAAEVLLLARDPHLAARAAWAMLREKGSAGASDALGGHADRHA